MTDFLIKTTLDSRPVTGQDSVILKLPSYLYEIIDGQPTYYMDRIGYYLREQSEWGAANVAERLHHADWTMTTDPETVRDLGLQHQCATCQAGVDQALAVLRDNPSQLIAVGVLYWAGDQPPGEDVTERDSQP